MSVLKKDLVTFKPGEMVITEKTTCTALYIVKEGQLQVFRIKDGKRIPMGIINSGEYIAEMAILSNSLHSSNVQALTHVTAVKIPRAAIDKQLEQAPTWLVALTRGLVERLRHANEILRSNNIIDPKMESAIKAMEEKNEAEEKAG